MYIQTDSQIVRPASSPRKREDREEKGEAEFSPPLFVCYARKVVPGHLFRSSRKYRVHPQLSIAAVRGERSVYLA